MEAKIYLKALLDGSNEIKIIGNKSDKYGRLLAHVLVDGQNLSSLMLNSGLARADDGKKRKGWC